MNMELPDVELGSWIVILADSNTGIILNREGEYSTTGVEDACYIFKNIDNAISFIKDRISSSEKPIEGVIYDSAKELYKLIQ